MFGMFGRSKYLNEVYENINFFINKAGVPKTNLTFETIRQEVELNSGEAWDNSVTWQSMIAEPFQQVAWAHKDYLYKERKLSTNQAAIFCITQFISSRADSEEPNEGDQPTEDMVASLKILWHFCGELATDSATEETYARVVIVPKKLNPF